MTKPAAMVCVLSYGGVDARTITCLHGDATFQTPGEQWWVTWAPSDAAVDRARSRMATDFLSRPEMGDVMLMVDHDLTWQTASGETPGDAGRIVAKCRELGGIVGAVVSKRAFGEGYGGYFPPDQGIMVGTEETMKLEDCYYVGGAFTAYHRNVFETLAKTLPLTVQNFYPFFLPMLAETPEGNPFYLSEDWAICKRARDAGLPVHVYGKPFINHWGHYGYTVADGHPSNNQKQPAFLNKLQEQEQEQQKEAA